jgi:murein DD-endopeptidase MepM/ murein hydrolase activator NlpD
MSNRVLRKTTLSVAALCLGAATLSGCTAIGGRSFGDPVMTGSATQSMGGNPNQAMPATLGAPVQTAENRYLPPANVGGGVATGYAAPMIGGVPNAPIGATPTVTAQPLPSLASSAPSGTPQAMPSAQPLVSAAPPPPAVMPAGLGAPPSNLGSLPVNSAVPQVAPSAPAAANAAGFSHTIQSGESLYTIARRYDVTAQAIVQANGLSSPDRIIVGQQLVIPGRADLLANRAPNAAPAAATPAPQQVAALPTAAPQQVQQPAAAPAQPAQQQAALPQPAAAAPAATPSAEPAMSGAERFRWPVSGRVITDFAASRGTGINIEVPEGTPVLAAENGTVIYTGSGVEGYGNLVLVRHPNGYVSAYAHLQSIGVQRGAVVNRGDSIGAAGMTGSVSRPQLHFELRRGATPVDPMPLLAS